MIRIIIVFAVVVLSASVYSQKPEFYKEDISFRINDNYFFVDGVYHFCNTGNKDANISLLYPFPTDSIFGRAEEISVFNLNDSCIINPVSSLADRVTIPVTVKAYKTLKVRIKYKQQLYSNKALYILKTTNNWKKSLDNVTYDCLLEKTISPGFSYIPDSTVMLTDSVKYYWKMKDFLPQKDFVIEW